MSKATEKIKANSARMDAAVTRMDRLLGAFVTLSDAVSRGREIHWRVVEQIAPKIREALGRQFDASGIGQKTADRKDPKNAPPIKHGDLRDACVTNAVVEAAGTGIFIGMARGCYQGLYAAAGRLNYKLGYNFFALDQLDISALYEEAFNAELNAMLEGVL